MEFLSLFTGEAVAAVEESRGEGVPSPVAVLASIIAPQGTSPSAQTTAVQVAATAVVAPQMFAALSAAGQSALTMVGLSLQSGWGGHHYLQRVAQRSAHSPALNKYWQGKARDLAQFRVRVLRALVFR